MMFDIRTPTFDELVSRIEDWPSISETQLISALGAEEARDIFRQFREQLAEEVAEPTKN